MADEIRQQISLDASKAYLALTNLTTGINQYNAALNNSVVAMQRFNKMGGKTVSALKKMAGDGAAAATQLSKLNKIKLPTAPKIAAGGVDTANIDAVTAATEKAGKAAKDTSKSWVLSWQTIGRVVLTQAIVRALNTIRQSLKAALQGAIDFQKGIAEIATISGDAIGGMSALEGVVKRVSDAFNVDIGDASEAAYQTISNQIAQTTADLESFLGAAAKFAKITKTDIATSVNLLSGTLNAFGKDVFEVEDVAAKFFKTIELGRTRAEELAQGLGTISPIASQLGITMEELNASIATLTINGIKTDKAITQIRGAMQGFLKPTEGMKDAMKELGFETGEQILEAYNLQDAIIAVTETTDGSAVSISKLFPRIRGLTGVIALADDTAGHFNKTLEQQKTALAGTYTDAHKLVVSTDAEKVTKFFNEVKNFFITDIGQRLLSGLTILLRLNVESPKSALQAAKDARQEILDGEIKMSKQLLQVTLSRIEDERQAMGQRAAEARKLFFSAADAASEANTAIVAGSEWALDSMMGPINAAVTGIKKASEEGRKLMKAFSDEASSSLATVQKTVFARSVGAADDPNVKLSMLRRKSAEESLRAQEMAAGATTQAELDAAKQLQASSRAYNDQAFAISKSIKKKYENGKATRDLTERELKLQKQQAGQDTQNLILRQNRWQKSLTKGESAVKDNTKSLAESTREIIVYQAEMEGLRKKLIEVQKTSADTSLTPEDQAAKAEEATKISKEFAAKFAEGVEKFAASPDKLVSGLFKEIQALDMSVELDTIMAIPTNMREVHGQLKTAFEALFAADPLNVQVAFVAEKAGKDVKTVTQLSQAQSGYFNTLGEIETGLAKADIGQKSYTKSQKDAIATLNTLEEVGKNRARRVVKDSKGELRLGGFLKKLDAENTAYNRILGSMKRIATEGPKSKSELADLQKELNGLDQSLLRIGNIDTWRDTLKQAFQELAAGASEARALVENQQSQMSPERDTTGDEIKMLGRKQAVQAANLRLQEFHNRRLREANVIQDESLGDPGQEAAQVQAAQVGVTAEVDSTNMGIDAMVAKYQQAEQSANAVAAATVRIGRAASSSQGPIINNPQADFNALGGRVGYLANGGRGTDTIPAMLSKGETVTNARSSRRFFSQLQAMNAGQKPIYRNDGGDTYNTNVGDINVSGASNPEQTARVVMAKIRREQRRGSAR